MSVRSSAAAGAATRSTSQARPLCGAQWRDVRRAASTARAVGAKSVSVHGVQLWLNEHLGRPDTCSWNAAGNFVVATAQVDDGIRARARGVLGFRRGSQRAAATPCTASSRAAAAGRSGSTCWLQAARCPVPRAAICAVVQGAVRMDRMDAGRAGGEGAAAPRGARASARSASTCMATSRCHDWPWATRCCLGT